MPIGRYTRSSSSRDDRTERREVEKRQQSAKKKKQEAKRIAFEKKRQEEEQFKQSNPPQPTPAQSAKKAGRDSRRQDNKEHYADLKRRILFDEEVEVADQLIQEEERSLDIERLRDVLLESERFQHMDIPSAVARHIASFDRRDNDLDSGVINEMIPSPRVGGRLLNRDRIPSRDQVDMANEMVLDHRRRQLPVPRAYPFDNTRLISGSQEINPIQGSGGGVPNTYVDHLAPESYISQDAHDKEEYIGANPRDHTSQDLRVIEQLRRQEYEDDADRVRDIVQEVEILSGGQNDSLMDGQDLVDEQKYDTDYDNHRGHSRSGIQRGRDAHAIPEIDLEDIESSLSQFFGEEDAPEGISDDSASIGRRFGQAIPRVRGGFNQDDDVQSVMSGSDSIMSTISGLTSLSDKDGSWFSKDKDLEKDIDVNERMSGINKIPMSKDAQTEIGKFNPMMNAGNKLLMSQGASLGTISEMRKKEINYKQPNRKFKNNAVDLVRLGNQTNIKMNQEYDP